MGKQDVHMAKKRGIARMAGVWTPAALPGGSMTQLTLDSVSTVGTACPTCGEEFASEGGMKSHHTQAHDESIAGVEFICDACGSAARKKRSHLEHDHNYCSEECRADGYGDHMNGEANPHWNGGLQALTCEHCGGTFETVPSQVETRRFCSCECAGEANAGHGAESHFWNGGPAELTCGVCGDTFETNRAEAESRKHCSYECYGERLRRRTGSDHPLWEGGRTVYYALRQLGTDTSWRTTRQRIRDRDGNECQSCGAAGTDRRLDVHHIVPVLAGGVSDDDLLTTLCRACHRKAEAYTRDIPEVRPILDVGEPNG